MVYGLIEENKMRRIQLVISHYRAGESVLIEEFNKSSVCCQSQCVECVSPGVGRQSLCVLSLVFIK